MRILTIFFLLISAVNAKPLFFVLTKGDTNFVVLTETPRYGVVVYRNGKKITESPVKPVSDAFEVPKILGNDYERILELTSSLDEYQLLRKLKHSRYQAGILAITNLKVSKLLGRVIIDAPVKSGKNYTYRVVFLKFNGKESDKTGKLSVKAREILPEPPTDIKPIAGDKKVDIKWKYRKWTGKAKDFVVSFNIYRRRKGEKSFTRLNKTPIIRLNNGAMDFIDQWVKNGVTYEYGLTSVDLIGRESKMSPIVQVKPVDTTPPAPPLGLIVIDSHGRAVLRWNYSLELDAAGYNVYRNTRIGEEYVRVNKKMLPFSNPIFVDSTVQPGRYFYAISAIDSSGNEGKKSNPMMVIIKDSMPPDPPENVKAVYKDKKIVITWSGARAKDLMGYYIYRGTIKDRLPKINAKPLPVDARRFVDKGYGEGGFSSGYTYFVGVTSVDSSRNESKLMTIKVTIPDSEPPQPPTFLKVRNTPEGFIKLSFTGSPSLDVSYYRIYRGNSVIKELKSGFFIDSTVKTGATYHYSITAVDTAGNESRPVKAHEITAKDDIPPTAPSGVVAIFSKNGVKITWNPSNASDLKGYNVYRSELPNGRYMKVNKDLLNSPEFIDHGGKKFHFYRISAVDLSGNESMTPYVRPEEKK